MVTPRNEISQSRKAVYYIGMFSCALGVLLFLTSFFASIADFGKPEKFDPFSDSRSFGSLDEFRQFNGFDQFDEHTRAARTSFLTAFGGVVLIGIGGFAMFLGARGLAGAGILLDPKQARKDIEPWSRMGGGIVQDALSETDLARKLGDRLTQPEPLIRVRCQKCQALNPEPAKFCNQCGSAI